MKRHPLHVMAGLVPAISIPVAKLCQMNRDARHKAGHDEREVLPIRKSK
jgi:hypothetical protein